MRSTMTVPALWAILSLVSSISARAVYTSDVECLQINQDFSTETYLANQTGYKQLKDKNWSETAWKSPSCIFQPSDTNELSVTVAQLQLNAIPFAIRSGGHSPSPYAANINGGVLIDLGGFDQVDYDAAQNYAVVGSGLTWGEVYNQLEEFNVTVVGGRVLPVGVGGLSLGGGLSYLSDMYGLVCDNVLNFEVVLGNGTVVNANDTSNSDLFWALKGGANNFGIVTRFTLATYPNPQVWGGMIAYTLEELPAIFDAMYTYQTVPDKDPKANLMLQGYVSNATIGVVLSVVYMAPEEYPGAFAPFYAINATSDSTKISSLSEFLDGQGPIDFPSRIDWRSNSFTPNQVLYERLSSIMLDSEGLAAIKGVESGTVTFGLQPISMSAIEAGIERGGNTLGLEHANQTWFVIDSGWSLAEDDMTVHNATREMVDSIVAEAQAQDVHLPYMFMNDASYDQFVIGGYGEESLANMTAIAAKYDPNQVFQQLVPGGFKLTPYAS